MPHIDTPNPTGSRAPLRPNELIWVTATSALIVFLSFTPQLFIIWPYFLRTPAFTYRQLLYALLPFNAGIAAIFYNYRLCIVTSPGRVPRHYEPDWDALGLDAPGTEAERSQADHDHAEGSSSESSPSDDDESLVRPHSKQKTANPLAVPRFCKTCNSYKPPRAHHCKHCKRCTLTMDHHGPWIANCVGHGNAPHFLRFLYAVEITIIYHFALISARIADWWSGPGAFWMPPGNAEMVLILLNYLGGIIVLSLVGIFCIYHTWLLCNGTTTIESSERDRVRTIVRRGRIREIHYPFDLGPYANICAVLGPTPLHWMVPGLRTQVGSGLMFACRRDTPAWLPYAWPPRDPTHPFTPGARSERSDRRLQRKRDELEQGWEWERNRIHQGEAYASASAFTYGPNQLNPALLPSNSTQRQVLREDGLRTRVRRGSEGFEVKPKRFDLVYAHEQHEWEAAQQEDAEAAADAVWDAAPTSSQNTALADFDTESEYELEDVHSAVDHHAPPSGSFSGGGDAAFAEMQSSQALAEEVHSASTTIT